MFGPCSNAIWKAIDKTDYDMGCAGECVICRKMLSNESWLVISDSERKGPWGKTDSLVFRKIVQLINTEGMLVGLLSEGYGLLQ